MSPEIPCRLDVSLYRPGELGGRAVRALDRDVVHDLARIPTRSRLVTRPALLEGRGPPAELDSL